MKGEQRKEAGGMEGVWKDERGCKGDGRNTVGFPEPCRIDISASWFIFCSYCVYETLNDYNNSKCVTE